MISGNRTFRFISALLILYLFTILLPVALHWEGLSQFITNFYGEQFELLELFGFSATIGLFLWAYIEGRLRRPASWRAWLPIWLTVFLGLFWLSILVETSSTPGDYPCYQNAAEALLQNKTPYRGCYFYPPLLAQGLAFLSKSIVSFGGLFGQGVAPDSTWPVVFYLFQSLQLLSILVAFRLSLALAQELKLKKLLSVIFVSSLFVLNTPLLRTVILHQVNLWILTAVLGIILLINKKPFWAGVITAFSGHIKVYPLIFALPFAVGKKWHALLGLVAGLAVFVLVPVSLGFRWSIWQQYGQFFLRFPQYNAPRNNSLYSIAANILVLTGADVTSEGSIWRFAPRVGYYLLVLGVIGWLVWRFLQTRKIIKGVYLFDQKRYLLVEYGFLMDMVAAQLLVSPSLWEHQWVIILPFVLWAVSFQYNLTRRPHIPAAFAGILMIYAVPSFDMIPFSYVRIAGLLVLLWITNPGLILEDELPGKWADRYGQYLFSSIDK
ncbi:MAG: hypothetical protein A2Z16_09240 [Chloroflexi bacterium RBG_16_54_18]|nr:MAG: hypothetical protein A2Z16_09240 [Chloroflexi bacterium RBG_16_54_18]